MIEKIKARGEELKTLQGHDRLQYLVDIAREVKPLADNEKIEDNKIRGCASNLWVVGNKNADGTMTQTRRRRLYHKRHSKIIIDIVNGESAEEVAQLTLDDFKHLGIQELLTMQRQIGFAGLIEKIIRLSK